jgi:hypothetical protein
MRQFGRQTILLTSALVGLGVALASTSTGAVEPDKPEASGSQSAAWQTWPDPLFTQPYIDKDEWRDAPVRHRYVHGGFKGTETRFSFYFPPKDQYKGHFFQPVGAYTGNEDTAQQGPTRTTSEVTVSASANTTIGFAVASGAYIVESNNGALQGKGQADDATAVSVQGYRANAAAAEYSRVLANEMYGKHHAYGYAYGGSGGSLRTICGVENTFGVWDGSVPYVTGHQFNMPNVFTLQAYAYRMLNNKWRSVVDALDPGGSGDMYAGLNQEEAAALREATRFGLPPRIWFAYDRLGYGPLASLINYLVQWDPTYFDDFWKVPGYLGANPPESLKHARVQQQTTIARVIMSDEAAKIGLPVPPASRGQGGAAIVPAAFQLKDMPKTDADLKGASLILKSGAAAGQVLSVAGVTKGLINISYSQEAFAAVGSIKAGDAIALDNSTYLAAQTYQRHQVPGPEWHQWDQYRGPDGNPLYPQRPVLLGPRYTKNGTGCTFTGEMNGKMIIVESLVDEYAIPVEADWYRKQVEDKLGSRAADSFRLWYIDNAMHSPAAPVGSANTRIVAYNNVLQQALRDVSAWVEKGVKPPENSVYKIVDSQVVVPATAAERKGVQPVVILTANGGARAEVGVGQPVTFEGTIEVPPGTGKVVGAEWDFEGAGDYPVRGQIKPDASGERATATTTYSFSKPGTYFAALRAESQRTPDGGPYAQIQNLGRARVVVK